MEEQILKTTIEKILKLSKEQVSKVLIFMAGLDAGYDLSNRIPTEPLAGQRIGTSAGQREADAHAGMSA